MNDMFQDLTGISSKEILGSGEQLYLCKMPIDTAQDNVEIVDSHDGRIIRIMRMLFSFMP